MGVRRTLVQVRNEATDTSQAPPPAQGPRRARLNKDRVLRAAVALADEARKRWLEFEFALDLLLDGLDRLR